MSLLWGVADLIRDTFKRGKYQDVILALTVLRRLDCVLADTKEKVLGKQAELRGRKLENLSAASEDRQFRLLQHDSAGLMRRGCCFRSSKAATVKL